MTLPCNRRRISLPKVDFAEAADTLKAVSDPHRLRILLALYEDEACVCDLNEFLPIEQPAVSHHLRVLKEEGLIAGERRGTWVYYRLTDSARLRLESVLAMLAPLTAARKHAAAFRGERQSKQHSSDRRARPRSTKRPVAKVRNGSRRTQP